jgi:hypothetical protein
MDAPSSSITCVVVLDIPLAVLWKLVSGTWVEVDIQIIKSAVLLCMLIIVVWSLVVRKLGVRVWGSRRGKCWCNNMSHVSWDNGA